MNVEKKWIDLRSDTVTQPTQQMREAMYTAQVGDDVYGDDPTVVELERTAAEMMGKEAALFVASGTMGNAVAVMSHTQRGDEILLSDTAHIVAHEVGGAAVLSQAFIHTLHFENGIFDAEQIRAAIRDRNNIHFPRTGMIWRSRWQPARWFRWRRFGRFTAWRRRKGFRSTWTEPESLTRQRH